MPAWGANYENILRFPQTYPECKVIAKGLEWFSVIIPHALDGLIPSVRAIKNLEELEEERRLFYVACSRAKEELFITMPSYVSTYNGFLSYPSRFLIEIDKTKYQYS